MSEEIALADATLAEIARLTITITGLRATITQQQREIAAERRARELAQSYADAARALHEWTRKWQRHHIISLDMIRAMDAMDAAVKASDAPDPL